MRKALFTIIIVLLAAAGTAYAQSVDTGKFMDTFIENFNSDRPENFNMHGSHRYYPNVPSLSEKGSDVMVMRINPETAAGAGRGPEIGTKKLTHFGTYTARIRVPDVKKVQPNVGAVVGYFTYRMDRTFGLSEIDFEWLIADPTLIYVGTWTGNADQRVGRTINLAKGEILYTIWRKDGYDRGRNHDFKGEANQPEKITAIPNYDASKRFYTYGFDWHPDRLTWWIIHPETNEKIILWDYKGQVLIPEQPDFTGIPQSPTTYLLNYWHTNDWPVDTNSKSIEAPAYPYALEVDWMKYEPFVEESQNWISEKNWQ